MTEIHKVQRLLEKSVYPEDNVSVFLRAGGGTKSHSGIRLVILYVAKTPE